MELLLKYPHLICELMECNLFKLVTQPVAGDVHLGNLVCVTAWLPSGDRDWSQAHIYALDLEDHRTTFPAVGWGAPVQVCCVSFWLCGPLKCARTQQWWQYAFSRRLEKQKLAAVNKALVAHRSAVLARLKKNLACVELSISPAQVLRGHAFIEAVENVS